MGQVEQLSLKDQKITFSPNASIILDQNAVSHPMTPYFFSIFISPDATGCETGAL